MVVTALVTTAAATTYATIEANNRAREQRKQQERALAEQRKANEQARQQAEAEAQRADIEYNRAVQKQPEVQAIVSRSEEAANQGPAATVLTGGDNMVNPVAQAVAQGKSKKGGGRGDASGGSLLTGQVGVDPSALNLGGNSLLGN
jgi:predicted phage gp36 major capsid-like protein|tara:strand:+ start:1176 stop:1613 length:438 start_codon:yes stop_codon:yes gene_type:complete